MALPLDGITVVSIEQAVAAPFATRQLADLGARVIKIERPGSGDFARGYVTRVRGLASDPRYAGNAKRVAKRESLHALIIVTFGRLAAPQLIERLEVLQARRTLQRGEG